MQNHTQIKEKRYTNEEIQKKLSENFKQFSKELKEKGIQIQGNSVKNTHRQKICGCKRELIPE